MTGPTELPNAWADLIQAVTLLAKGRTDDISPFNCEHDELSVMADPEKFTEAEIMQLKEWGFNDYGDGSFSSFRYGSA